MHYFRYHFLGSNKRALPKATKVVGDGDGVKVRFTNKCSYNPIDFNAKQGVKGSINDLLQTAKGKCLFHADAGHGEVCSLHCNPRVFHSEKDHYNKLKLWDTRDLGIGVFNN